MALVIFSQASWDGRVVTSVCELLFGCGIRGFPGLHGRLHVLDTCRMRRMEETIQFRAEQQRLPAFTKG